MFSTDDGNVVIEIPIYLNSKVNFCGRVISSVYYIAYKPCKCPNFLVLSYLAYVLVKTKFYNKNGPNLTESRILVKKILIYK